MTNLTDITTTHSEETKMPNDVPVQADSQANKIDVTV